MSGGVFYQVMRLLRDHKLGGRLHVVVCIRDIVMSSVYRSEHAPRYYNEPHIRVLTWDRSSLLYLLGQKLQRLPPSLLMRRATSGAPPRPPKCSSPCLTSVLTFERPTLPSAMNDGALRDVHRSIRI